MKNALIIFLTVISILSIYFCYQFKNNDTDDEIVNRLKVEIENHRKTIYELDSINKKLIANKDSLNKILYKKYEEYEEYEDGDHDRIFDSIISLDDDSSIELLSRNIGVSKKSHNKW
jgi:hypothetical protein